MTAATPPPPRDGEVCATCGDTDWQPNGSMCDHDDRPAAPSEPPAADSPTLDQDQRMVSALERGMPTALAAQAVYGVKPPPSPVDTMEPPAETQQDDAQRESVQPRAHRDAAGVLWVPVEVDPVWVRIAARPSADTETLREQVETWIDEAPEQTAGLDLLRQIIGRPR